MRSEADKTGREPSTVRRKPRAYRNVARVDRPGGGRSRPGLFHGWVVTVKRRGKRYFGVFPDRKHGGRRGALKQALGWRDELEAKLLPPVKFWRRCSARSRTGIVGVVLLRRRIRGRLFRHYWANWQERGRQVGRAFSANKYGEAGARARATALRREAIVRILAEGREALLAGTRRERATLRK